MLKLISLNLMIDYVLICNSCQRQTYLMLFKLNMFCIYSALIRKFIFEKNKNVNIDLISISKEQLIIRYQIM